MAPTATVYTCGQALLYNWVSVTFLLPYWNTLQRLQYEILRYKRM